MAYSSLPTSLRRSLEKAVREARVAAEAGAAAAIRRLGIEESKAPEHLDDSARALRRRLRAHARTLGDAFDRSTERQEVRRLIEATAYAHWHRMLFARFLAERNLLRHPGHDVPVSLADCEELAAEERVPDGWAVAERYAAAMLPAVFQPDDPLLALDLAPEYQQALQGLARGLDSAVFQASDSLGWTYQFWRAAEKDAVNKANGKIGADELPAATQLFTEPYMVRFLLHNTLGAWWAGKVLATNSALARSAPDEVTLRSACALSGVSWEMLRFVREGDGWRPAAGTFPGWPTEAKAITLLDPCCGSGHFLTEALPILAALRQAEEGVSLREAISAVLRDNIFGLEIDGRCVQIAAFAVALSAWAVGGWQSLPLPHIAWAGAPPPLLRSEFVALANGDFDLAKRLGILHELFVQAPTLGSLIDPSATAAGSLFSHAQAEGMERAFAQLVERLQGAEPEREEGAIAARGMADATAILNRRYTLQATNVPYLGRGKQAPALADFIGHAYPEAKADLATAMLTRMLKLAGQGGTIASVTPQNWLFLGSYKHMRRILLNDARLNFIVDLGPAAFNLMNWWAAGTALIGVTNSKPTDMSCYFAISADTGRDLAAKPALMAQECVLMLKQSAQTSNPDHRISVHATEGGTLLARYAVGLNGMHGADSPRFRQYHWERLPNCDRWRFLQCTVNYTSNFQGRESAFYWPNEGKIHYENPLAYVKGRAAWGREGVVVSMMRELPVTRYTGEFFDISCTPIVPHDPAYLPAIWTFCSSPEYKAAVRRIDRKLNVTNATSSKFLST